MKKLNIRNKRILVTGADGFIGSHLVESLIDLGCKVKAFCYYNSFNSWGWLDTLPKDKIEKIEVFLGDIRDLTSVNSAAEKIDIIMHLAALISIPYSYQSPESYLETNIKGTLNILQASRTHRTERILITSTSEVYGTAKYIPIDENHPTQGQSPYSATKIGADRITESFFKSFNMPITIVRPFNTYGPRQSARAVIPSIIIQLLSGSDRIKLGSLFPRRDFNYVKDVCNGFIEIAKSEKTAGHEINIASGQDISIRELAEKIIEKINPEAKIIEDMQRIRPEKSEVIRLQGSNKKIKKLTAWTLKYTLEQGLKETISWFKNNLDRYKVDIYNV